MALFGCIFTAPGHVVAPDAFKASVQRGNNFRAAAFRADRGDGHVFIVRAFNAGTELKFARDNILKQLTRGGTIGLKFLPADLQLQDCRAFDTAPYYTAAEILFDTGLLRAQIAAAPAQAVAAENHYAVLGLEVGAPWENVKGAFRRKALQLHPDKGGDSEEFDRARVAYDALNPANAVRVAPETVIKALPYEADVDAHEGMRRAALEKVESLREQLKAAEEQLAQVSKVANKKCGDVRKTTQRMKAQKFMQQFRCSAARWDTAEVMRWFQPKRGFPPNEHTSHPAFKEWLAECEDIYGEDLRRGNTDLDPYIKFIAWNPSAMFSGNTAFRIKVGLDHEDALDHGIEIQVAYGRLSQWGAAPCAKTLARLGWVREDVQGRSSCWYSNFDTASLKQCRDDGLRKRFQVEVDSEAAPPSDEEMENIRQSIKRRRTEDPRGMALAASIFNAARFEPPRCGDE